MNWTPSWIAKWRGIGRLCSRHFRPGGTSIGLRWARSTTIDAIAPTRSKRFCDNSAMPVDALNGPPRWIEANLGSVASITLGGTPPTEIAGFWGGEIPWMSSGDVHLRRISEVSGRISDAGLRASNATLVDPPAVAVALAGQGKTR